MFVSIVCVWWQRKCFWQKTFWPIYYGWHKLFWRYLHINITTKSCFPHGPKIVISWRQYHNSSCVLVGSILQLCKTQFIKRHYSAVSFLTEWHVKWKRLFSYISWNKQDHSTCSIIIYSPSFFRVGVFFSWTETAAAWVKVRLRWFGSLLLVCRGRPIYLPTITVV